MCSRSLHPHLYTPTSRRLSTTHLRRRHHRYKISTIRSSSDSAATSPTKPDVLRETRDITGVQSLIDVMSSPVRIASSALIVAAAVAGRYGVGSRFCGSHNAALGVAVVVGVVGAEVAYALNSYLPQVAAVNLHNYVVGCDDPGAITKEDIDAIANKYI